MYQFPYKWYAATVGVFLSIFGVLARRLTRNPHLLPETPPSRDLFLLGVATFRLSRMVTKDRVTAVFRLPFVYEGRGEEALEGTKEEPKAEAGWRQDIGQLITCPWCASVWAGLFNTSLLIFFPRIGRYFLMTIAASGMSELLDPVFPLLNYLSGYIHDEQQIIEGSGKVQTPSSRNAA
jgi:ABC-type Fe3+-siderophore transport system permease subunit